jgi:pimeloyl-ACP methyl ester carboxylesterase
MPYLRVNESDLFYTASGTGPSLVLVHGWTCDWVDWAWLIPLLEENFRVISYNRRTIDDSTGRALDLRRQSADLAEVIIRLAGGSAVLVGHSQGGVIVSTTAVEYPDLTRGIVVLDAPYAAPDAARPVIEQMKTTLSEAARNGDDEKSWRTVQSFFDSVLSPVGDRAWMRTLIHRRVETLSAAAIHADFVSLWNFEEIAYQPRAGGYLSRRTCPVLVLHTNPAMAEFERTTFQHPGSGAVALPNVGHWLQIENPHEVNAQINEWWKALSQ